MNEKFLPIGSAPTINAEFIEIGLAGGTRICIPNETHLCSAYDMLIKALNRAYYWSEKDLQWKGDSAIVYAQLPQ